MTTWTHLAGWTLVHFLWQGALIAAAAAAALRLFRAASPHARYAVACAALAAMLMSPAVTAFLLASPARTGGLTLRIAPAATHVAAPNVSGTPNATGSVNDPNGWNDPNGPDVQMWLPWIVAVWLCGVAILLLRLAGGCWRVRRLHRAALAEPASEWQAAAHRLAQRLRLQRAVLIVDSVLVDTPTALGWLRPVIVLPVAAMANLSPAQVEAILAHELAHIRRHDFLVNVLQTIAETLLFYHPAVWWISTRIRAERENCCDDVAVEVCGDPVEYAAALTELAAASVARAPLAVAATSGALLPRVRRLLHIQTESDRRAGSILVVGLAVALAIAGGSIRAVSLVPVAGEDAPAGQDGRFGPPDVNRLLGFELFPGPTVWPTDDPRASRSWGVTIAFASGEVPLIGFTARSLIRHAYRVHGMPIVGVPRWMDEESFDLSVASDASIVNGVADPEAMSAALRQLLETQLGLVAQIETREMPAYALVRSNPDGTLGPSITPSTDDCFGGRGGTPPVNGLRPPPSFRFCGIEDGLLGVTAAGVTMEEFARAMRREVPLRPDLPVVDRTGLPGTYDFTLRFGFLPVAAIGAGHPSFGALIEPLGFRSLFTALPEQLGLQLVESTAPFEVLVIDRIERPSS